MAPHPYVSFQSLVHDVCSRTETAEKAAASGKRHCCVTQTCRARVSGTWAGRRNRKHHWEQLDLKQSHFKVRCEGSDVLVMGRCFAMAISSSYAGTVPEWLIFQQYI